jgi:hypothetical protein
VELKQQQQHLQQQQQQQQQCNRASGMTRSHRLGSLGAVAYVYLLAHIVLSQTQVPYIMSNQLTTKGLSPLSCLPPASGSI